MYIDPTLLATMTGLIGALAAATWSYLMASKVAAPRAKRMIVDALTREGPELVAVREHLIQPALDAQKQAFTAIPMPTAMQIASEVENAVKANLGALSIDTEALAQAIGPQISTHVNMALKQMEAQQSKRVGQFLKDAGLEDQLEGMTEAMKEEALAQAGPGAQFLAEIMAAKIPKNATVAEKAWLTISKAAAVQMAQNGMMGIQLPGQASQAVQGATGYSPGL